MIRPFLLALAGYFVLALALSMPAHAEPFTLTFADEQCNGWQVFRAGHTMTCNTPVVPPPVGGSVVCPGYEGRT